MIETVPAILLGPLAVEPTLQGQGIGKALLRHGLAAARREGVQLLRGGLDLRKEGRGGRDDEAVAGGVDAIIAQDQT